jgi:hypothetical protein
MLRAPTRGTEFRHRKSTGEKSKKNLLVRADCVNRTDQKNPRSSPPQNKRARTDGNPRECHARTTHEHHRRNRDEEIQTRRGERNPRERERENTAKGAGTEEPYGARSSPPMELVVSSLLTEEHAQEKSGVSPGGSPCRRRRRIEGESRDSGLCGGAAQSRWRGEDAAIDSGSFILELEEGRKRWEEEEKRAGRGELLLSRHAKSRRLLGFLPTPPPPSPTPATHQSLLDATTM